MMSAKKYRHKNTLEAIQYDGQNGQSIAEWAGPKVIYGVVTEGQESVLQLVSDEGPEEILKDQWVTKDTLGNVGTLGADTFGTIFEEIPVETLEFEALVKTLRETYSKVETVAVAQWAKVTEALQVRTSA